MARKIYAGADFFAMPSRFEPCGQGQMIALRYGTPPIVHRVGRTGRHRHRRDDPSGRRDGFASRRDRRRAARARARRRCAPSRRRAGLGGPARSRHGGRLRLGDGLGAALRRGIPAGDRDPARGGEPARLAERRASSAAVELGRVRPLRRVRGAREGDDVVGADPCREPGERRRRGPGRRPAGSPRTSQIGMPSAAGSEMSARPPSQSPFSSRTARAASISSWVTASALARTSSAGQVGFRRPTSRTAVSRSG